MAVMSTGDFARSVAPQMPTWFGMGYNRNPDLISRLFNVIKSDQAVEEDILVSGLGLVIQTSEGEETPYDSARQGYIARYMHSDYRLGVIVTQNLIEDGKGLKIAEMRAKMLGVAVGETRNILGHTVFNLATDATNAAGGDGQALLSTSHPIIGGTVSNRLATDADLSEAALEQAYLEMGSITDNRGLKVDVQPVKLLVARANRYEAHRILKSDLRPGDLINDTNALKDLGDFKDLIVSNYLTDEDAWFILTNQDMQGLTWYDRKAPTFTNDTHFDTDNAKFKVHMRFSRGFTDFRCIFGSPGA